MIAEGWEIKHGTGDRGQGIGAGVRRPLHIRAPGGREFPAGYQAGNFIFGGFTSDKQRGRFPLWALTLGPIPPSPPICFPPPHLTC